MQPITVRARDLRRKQTPEEAALWQLVRNRQTGFKIVRQKPILLDYFGKKRAFVADFYCSEARLVIEIDGSVHTSRNDYDTLRTTLLEQKGLHLIRYTNHEVMTDTDMVADSIRREAGRLIASPHPLTPSPRVERGE